MNACTRFRSLVLALAFIAPSACTAPRAVDAEASASTAAPTLRSELATLAPLCGRTWVAQFAEGGFSDTQTYEPILGGQFVRNAHAVADANGKVVYSGETVYGWDAPTSTLRWWYFNATGGWIDGTIERAADGSLVFDGTNHAGGNQTARVRSSARFDARGRQLVTTWFWRDGAWVPERELVYVAQSR
jgi:hypothetical protein